MELITLDGPVQVASPARHVGETKGVCIPSNEHWALQYLEKALAAIFEAKNMARIGPCWRQLVPFIGSYHWPKRQCQASNKGFRPPGCKQKIVCESTRKRKIFQNIKFKIRNIFTLLCQHGGKSYFTPSNDARINYKSWEIRSGKNLYCLNWWVFCPVKKQSDFPYLALGLRQVFLV